MDLRSVIGPAIADRYSIERELGAGAMAVVFLARDRKHGRRVAIKVMKPDLASVVGTDRFKREIDVVAGLSHPHILPLYDSGIADGLLYFVMPHVEGESLRDRLRREGRLPVSDAIRMTREVAGALGYAHRRGFVHRDVKPDNILLSEDHALLADFGVAHLVGSSAVKLTGTGLALGTPTYFSPEQATGEHAIDGRSDIYSLGCVLYEALTGEPPFRAESLQALVTQHVAAPPPKVRDTRSEVSEGVEAVVQTALQKEPGRRFQTAEEMAGSLDLVTGGLEVFGASGLRGLFGPKHPWWHGRRLAALVFTVLFVVAGAGALLRSVIFQPPDYAGVYPTYAILPYANEDMSEEELELSKRAANQLRWQLESWSSLEIVGRPAQEGISARVAQAGLGPPSASLAAGLALLDQLKASHIIYVSAYEEPADSLRLTADIYPRDAKAGERKELQYASQVPAASLDSGTATLALQILDLAGEDVSYEELLNRSSNHLAQHQFNDGREALEDWKLAEAEAHFRGAIAEDPEFALAHFFLAETMYWRTVQDAGRILNGDEIARHVRQADRLGTGKKLRPGERRALDAFHAFWDGDYPTARLRYDSILARNPHDLDALVLAGAVEYDDNGTRRTTDGGLEPRQDLDRARALFDSAVALYSGRQLAWGRLFDIDRTIMMSARRGACPGFEGPDGPPVAPWQEREAADQHYFCPYLQDGSILWSREALTARQKALAVRGVEALQRRTVERLQTWARVEKDQARAHDELASWMLWERSLAGCDADAVATDSLLRGARAHLERALELRGDTTPEDGVRLAVLQLASGELPAAVALTDSSLAGLGDWASDTVPPPEIVAADVFLAAGRGTDAARVVRRWEGSSTFAVVDTVSGEVIAGGPVRDALDALGALGLTADQDPGASASMGALFERLDRVWRPRSPRERVLLEQSATPIVTPALLRAPDRWDAWFEGWETHGLAVPPAWRGMRFAASDPSAARTELDAAVAGLAPGVGDDRPLRAYDFYLPILLAERLGEDGIAAELRRRARACPLSVTSLDLGWGMRSAVAGGD